MLGDLHSLLWFSLGRNNVILCLLSELTWRWPIYRMFAICGTWETLKFMKKKPFPNKVKKWRSPTLLKTNSFTVSSENFKVKWIFSRTTTKLKVLGDEVPQFLGRSFKKLSFSYNFTYSRVPNNLFQNFDSISIKAYPNFYKK